MAVETLERKEQTQEPAASRQSLLARVLDFVRRDSRREPENYLEETKVPHGGE